MVQITERQEVNQKHLHNPFPGDYWEDHFIGVCVVVATSPTTVAVCETRLEDSTGWTWDIEQLKFYTKAAFIDKLSYSTKSLGTWADVHPEIHLRFVIDVVIDDADMVGGIDTPANSIEIIDVVWYSSVETVGIVLVKDTISGQHMAYIGVAIGGNTKQADMEHIAQFGAKFPHRAAVGVFGHIPNWKY